MKQQRSAMVGNGGRQRGALILMTLLILLIVSIVGMASMDSTGIEMQMSSNSRSYQAAFEAAEYTLSRVENDLLQNGFFSADSLSNTACGSVCFDSSCSNGYCFDGVNPNLVENCVPNAPATEPYESAAIWSNGALHRTLNIPSSSATAKYLIEYRCYTSRDPLLPFNATNGARMFRITAYVVGDGGRSRVMLRTTLKQI